MGTGRFRGRVVLLAAAAAVVLPAGAAAAAPAATSGCDAVVVDAAHVLGDGRAVAKAATALGHQHATVRVRTYRTVPDGDLDAAVDAQVERCPSWQDGDGNRREDLLVLAVSVTDRRTGIYYGDSWTAALDGEQEQVQTGTINPRLKRGEYADAVTAGLTVLGHLVAEAGPPDDGTSDGTASDDSGSDGTTSDGTTSDGTASDPGSEDGAAAPLLGGPGVDGTGDVPGDLRGDVASATGGVAIAVVAVIVLAVGGVVAVVALIAVGRGGGTGTGRSYRWAPGMRSSRSRSSGTWYGSSDPGGFSSGGSSSSFSSDSSSSSSGSSDGGGGGGSTSW
jgi:uncharacterized membrane protein YgcG